MGMEKASKKIEEKKLKNIYATSHYIYRMRFLTGPTKKVFNDGKIPIKKVKVPSSNTKNFFVGTSQKSTLYITMMMHCL